MLGFNYISVENTAYLVGTFIVLFLLLIAIHLFLCNQYFLASKPTNIYSPLGTASFDTFWVQIDQWGNYEFSCYRIEATTTLKSLNGISE